MPRVKCPQSSFAFGRHVPKVVNCQAQGPLSCPLLVNSYWNVYEMSRGEPEIGSVMGWPTTHQATLFELKTASEVQLIR